MVTTERCEVQLRTEKFKVAKVLCHCRGETTRNLVYAIRRLRHRRRKQSDVKLMYVVTCIHVRSHALVYSTPLLPMKP
jgi:hypothetical protein